MRLGNYERDCPLDPLGYGIETKLGMCRLQEQPERQDIILIAQWDDVRLDLSPRFPILGGWKSNFFIGYNLPSKFHISTNDAELYTLNVTYGLPYADVLARNYSVKIVLPEGANDIKVKLIKYFQGKSAY